MTKRISVSVKVYSREARVEKVDDTHFIVAVKEPPVKGKATRAVARALADYFNVPISAVQLITGRSSRNKVFEVESIH